MGFGIALGIITVIYLLLLIFFIKRIRIATRLLAEASKVSLILTYLVFSSTFHNFGYFSSHVLRFFVVHGKHTAWSHVILIITIFTTLMKSIKAVGAIMSSLIFPFFTSIFHVIGMNTSGHNSWLTVFSCN